MDMVEEIFCLWDLGSLTPACTATDLNPDCFKMTNSLFVIFIQLNSMRKSKVLCNVVLSLFTLYAQLSIFEKKSKQA